MSETIASIIIPNYNGERFLRLLMESLFAQSDLRFEIVVVDDGSSDNGPQILRSEYPQVHLVENEKNLGFAGTCNVGIAASDRRFVVLLNNDTTVDRHWFARAVSAFDADDVGSVASLVLLTDPPNLIDSAGDVYSVVGGAAKRGHRNEKALTNRFSSDCFSACGASAFYRRSALDRAGVLDERFTSYYEDVDLGFRLAWAGYRCRFVSESICNHHLSASYSPRGWNYHFNSARNAEIVWQANVPELLRQRYAAGRRAFLAMQGVNKMRQGVWKAYAAGRNAAKREIDWIQEKRRHIESIASIDAAELESRLERNWFSLHVRGSLGLTTTEGPVA